MVPGAVEIGEKVANKVLLCPGEDRCFLRVCFKDKHSRFSHKRSTGKWKGETIVSSKNLEKSGLTKAKERFVGVGGDCSSSRSSLYPRSAIRKEGTEGLDTVGANSYTIFDNERSGFHLACTKVDRRKHDSLVELNKGHDCGRKFHLHDFHRING
ncbi:hypothetical protein F5890DRAFT_1528783 [Lentinula detonsa]|uniref:Uncharacterized protein n=1 Tax=Lentinula detonsa TaxID=2804962 RepID=A0AA38PWR1_9AGAR|nr:hypothetical protein F5890DRAFT_1528783 [Lentinula detonsa]